MGLVRHAMMPIVMQMQELTGAVIQVEDELKACSQEIELLKLSTPL